jgi:hypothetical protein
MDQEGLKWQKENPADGEEGRRLWRRDAVPDERPANTKKQRTHEHHRSTGELFPYVARSERWRDGLSTVEPSSAAPMEGRLVVEQIR